MGTPVTLPEFAAVRPGTCPTISDGLVMTPACDGCVTIDDVEFDRAGDDGRWLTNEASEAAGGDGAVRELPESRCRWCDPFGNGDGGANTDVGVGTGVFWFDETAVPDTTLVFFGPTSPVYTSPSSPGAKDRVEQKPSDDEMSSVRPSLDHVRSVNVAQCRLLTMQIGVCCCVSYRRTESCVATA